MATIELIFSPEDNLVRLRCLGKMDVKTLLEACDTALSDPRYRPGMGRIWDVQEADLDQISTDEVKAITGYLSSRPDEVNNVRVGLVADSSLGFGLARVFASVSSHTSKNDVRPFRSVDAAVEWVSGRVNLP